MTEHSLLLLTGIGLAVAIHFNFPVDSIYQLTHRNVHPYISRDSLIIEFSDVCSLATSKIKYKRSKNYSQGLNNLPYIPVFESQFIEGDFD